MPACERTFEIASRLAAPPARVWERVSTMAGINDEIAPYLRMTVPAHARSLTIDDAATGRRLFRSWILLFGVLPIDYDDLYLEAVEPERGFRERSSMLSARAWHHDRTVEPAADGADTIVTDRVRFVPRLRPLGPLLAAIVRRVFAHRHRRLQRAFGARGAGAGVHG